MTQYQTMQRTSNILFTKQKEKLCQETYENTIWEEEWNKNRSLLKFTKYRWHNIQLFCSHATNVEHFNNQTERKIMSGEHMKIWYEKKNEIKTDHLWNDGCRQLF